MNPFLLLAQEASATDPGWTDLGWTAFSSVPGRLVLATVFGAVGIWMMLPGPRRWSKAVGGLGAVLSAGLATTVLTSADPLRLDSFIFWMLAAVTVSAAVATITSRSPVYSAIWFALVLLGVAGLFLLNGAQFLGVATVAVYAGAIVVTLLFVLMLAQPEGHTFYDRVSWGKWPSLLGCLAGVGMAMLILWAVTEADLAALATAHGERAVLADQHVARLGGQLFTRHLIGVQLAGTLLLAALVGAIAMASHGSTRRAAGQWSENEMDRGF